MKKGHEATRSFDPQGLGTQLTLPPGYDEGGGDLAVCQAKGSAQMPVSDWMRGYRDEMMTLVRNANGK